MSQGPDDKVTITTTSEMQVIRQSTVESFSSGDVVYSIQRELNGSGIKTYSFGRNSAKEAPYFPVADLSDAMFSRKIFNLNVDEAGKVTVSISSNSQNTFQVFSSEGDQIRTHMLDGQEYGGATVQTSIEVLNPLVIVINPKKYIIDSNWPEAKKQAAISANISAKPIQMLITNLGEGRVIIQNLDITVDTPINQEVIRNQMFNHLNDNSKIRYSDAHIYDISPINYLLEKIQSLGYRLPGIALSRIDTPRKYAILYKLAYTNVMHLEFEEIDELGLKPLEA